MERAEILLSIVIPNIAHREVILRRTDAAVRRMISIVTCNMGLLLPNSIIKLYDIKSTHIYTFTYLKYYVLIVLTGKWV